MLDSTCVACWKGGELIQRPMSPILPGWPKGWGQPPPQLGWFHKECYQPWYKEIYYELSVLDRSLNECAFFVRSEEDPYSGMYVRGGLELPCKSWWRGEEMEHHYPFLKTTPWWVHRRYL
jgi:hypothetical protein